MTPHGRLASDTSPRTANRIQRANLASKGQSRLPLLSVPLFFNPDPADLLRFLVNDPAAGQGAVVVLCRFRPIADSDSDGRGQQQTSINTALPPASELALSATAGGDWGRPGKRRTALPRSAAAEAQATAQRPSATRGQRCRPTRQEIGDGRHCPLSSE
jgi:hypothetical protein